MKAHQLPLPIRDKRLRHWFWVQDVVIEEYGYQLGPGGLAVYFALCKYADREERTRASMGRLAYVTGMSIASVKRRLRQLKSLGLIEITPNIGRRGVNEYVLLEPRSALPDEGGVQARLREESALSPDVGGGVQVPTKEEAHSDPGSKKSGSMTPDLYVDGVDLSSDQHHHHLDQGGVLGGDHIEPGQPDHAPETEAIYQALWRRGITPLKARQLAGSGITLHLVQAWDRWIELRGGDEKYGIGFLIRQLETGDYPPP